MSELRPGIEKNRKKKSLPEGQGVKKGSKVLKFRVGSKPRPVCSTMPRLSLNLLFSF